MFWAMGNGIGQVALPAFSSSLAKQPEEPWTPPLQTVCNLQETKYFSTNDSLPAFAALRPDFETFAETVGSRLHWGRSMSYALLGVRC
jgi:hypothetical protein